MLLTLPATVPSTCLSVVCSSVSVFIQLLRAQLNALLCLLPAKSPLHAANIRETQPAL